MTTLRSQLSDFVRKIGFSTWGVADIGGLHPLACDFPKALSVTLSYKIPFEKYDEPSYYALTVQVRSEFERRFAALVDYMLQNNIRHRVPGSAAPGTNDAIPVFPHKLAAVRAGLGWIGKSTLLVTPEYGPRVRLGTVLLADDLEADVPVTTSSCGECTRCRAACPNEAVYDSLWQPEVSAVPQFSAVNCGRRKAYVEQIGRSHSCGHCLLVCPVGADGIELRTSGTV
jgi:epoxyqueuosine reductase QueG